MPVDLPEDMLREIVGCAVAQPGGDEPSFLGALACTNKLLHSITVPLLFRSLRFNNKASNGFSEPNIPLIHLTRAYNRARSLYCAPHLLEHVSELTLDQWNQKVVGSSGASTDDMVPVIYECLVMLIERMPRLQHLKISSSPIITPLLRLLFSSPQIDRVTLSTEPGGADVDIPSDLPISHHIRHFSYRPTGDALPMDGYFRVILEHCSQDLQSLEIPSTELQRVISLTSHHPLSLRILAVNCHAQSSGVIQDMWRLLPLCPELRELKISPFTANDPPHDLTPGTIPYLESICAQSMLVPIFTVGRAVKKVYISGRTDISLHPVREIAGHSMALRELTLYITIDSYQELLMFIRSLGVYPHLVVLKIALLHRTRGASLKSKMTAEEHERLRATLSQLRTLRVCIITFAKESHHPTETQSTEHICPVGSICNPDDRGHLSLEIMLVECVHVRWWVWYHAEGWHCMPTSYCSPYYEL